MANEVSAYVAGLPEPERTRVDEIYSTARRIVPGAVEGLSYAMPALLYKGRGLLAVMSTKKHIGVYPFSNLAELGDAATLAGLETTKGSIHLRGSESLPPDLLEKLLLRRIHRIDQL